MFKCQLEYCFLMKPYRVVIPQLVVEIPHLVVKLPQMFAFTSMQCECIIPSIIVFLPGALPKLQAP